MSSLMEEGGASTTTCICPSESLQEIIPIDVKIDENCSLRNSAKIPPSENEPSVVAENQKKYSAFRVIDFESADQVTQKETQVERKRKNRDGSCLNSAQSKVETQGKDKKHRVSRCNLKDKEEKKLKARKKKVPEVPACGYIHVRARRGQATDSHSLAERVRREKISERMKLLQGLVPGCDKITGKTHMLDEIINYVNSLQNQVEFLSMKLASVNTLSYNFGVDLNGFMAKPENSSNLVSQLASMQQSSPTIPTQSTSFVSSATTFATTNNYPTLDQSISILLQEHSPNAVYQDNENLLCDVITNQRQRALDQSEFHKLSYFQ